LAHGCFIARRSFSVHVGTAKNMSKTIAPFFLTYPLQLQFFKPGIVDGPCEGHVRKKTVPYAIVAQVREGAYFVRSCGKLERFPPGSVVYVPANTAVEFSHHDGKKGRMISHWLHFHFSYHGLLDYLAFYDTPLRLPERVSREAGALIEKALAMRQDQAGSPDYLALQHSLASRMLQLVCSVSKEKPNALPSFARQRLFPMLEFIRGNLSSLFHVDELARVASLSSARLHAIFKAEFGCSPMRYVKRFRLETAARLLATPDFKLETIAAMTGFADAFHLSHSFKGHFGMSP
jgi:AraC-like DNA-binding protein